MEQLNYNLLFRWFVGLNADESVWDATVYTKNRERLLQGNIAEEFFMQVLEQAQIADGDDGAAQPLLGRVRRVEAEALRLARGAHPLLGDGGEARDQLADELRLLGDGQPRELQHWS